MFYDTKAKIETVKPTSLMYLENLYDRLETSRYKNIKSQFLSWNDTRRNLFTYKTQKE